MGSLSPVAFDIETSGLDEAAVVTVVGLAMPEGVWLAMNTTGRDADASQLRADVQPASGSPVQVAVHPDEQSLLAGLRAVVTERIDGDSHYITAYNGETWSGGFDLQFLRSACVRCDIEWPFPDIAFADTMVMVDRFYTGDDRDLAGVYELLIGGDHPDPFADSEQAIDCHADGNWVPLLLHNLADIQRTRELALLAGQYVSKSDFRMKNLGPPDA